MLELNGQYLDLVNAYETAIEVSGKVNDSLYNTCISMFNILSRSGIKPARDIAFFPNVTAIWLFWRLVTETIKWQWIMQKKTYNINAKLTII